MTKIIWHNVRASLPLWSLCALVFAAIVLTSLAIVLKVFVIYGWMPALIVAFVIAWPLKLLMDVTLFE